MWNKLKDMHVEDPFQFWGGVFIVIATVVGIIVYS